MGSNFLSSPPEIIPSWAVDAAAPFRGKDESEILAVIEEKLARIIEIESANLPSSIRGLVFNSGKRSCIYINRCLSGLERRFVFFHELYHLMTHSGGAAFWSYCTLAPMDAFE